MPLFDSILERARANPQTVVLPESADPRVVEAASRIARDRLAVPVLVGNPESIYRVAEKADLTMTGIEIADPATDSHFSAYAETLFELRKAKGVDREQADNLTRSPLYFGALMLRNGDADGYVAGAANTTTDVLRAALQIIGMAESARLVSSFFIMEHDLPHQAIRGTAVYADCAMVIDPDAEQLADIAINTADSASGLLDMDPRVALLSFSTAGSAAHPHVDKVRRAGELVASSRPDIKLMPEVQFDAAIMPEILASKAPGIDVEAPANVFIFPELQSANIGYKIAQRIGGVTAIGPILQGLGKPVNDLSRGCSVEDIVQLVAVTAVQSQNQNQ